jgi:hypothetical protein
MGGKVSLPLTIEIAFTAGALDTGALTWTDVSTYVRKESISFNRGWDAESQEPIAGRASLSFNNESGNFTPGKTGAFGLIRNRLPIRIKQGSTVLWTGLVESWRIGWTNGMRSKVDVTCVDRWAALRRLKLDGRFIEKVTAAQSPAYFWPCTEASGNRLAATAGGVDFISNNVSPVNAGATANPQSWLTLPVAAPNSNTTALQAPSMAKAGSFVPAGTTNIAFTVSAWLQSDISGATNQVQFATATGGSFIFLSASRGASNVYMKRSGDSTRQVDYTVSPTPGWRHLCAVVSVNGSGSTTVTLYVNGVSVGTAGGDGTYTSGGWYDVLDYTTWGVFAAPGVGVSYVGVWHRALSAAEVLAQYQAGNMSGWAGETAPVRAARLQAVAPTPVTLSTTGTFTIPMSKQDLADKPLADALLECAQAEDGALHIGTDGWPKLTSRDWRTQATVAFTIPAKALASDICWTLDDQQLTNSASVDRMVGDVTAGTATGRNDASVALYGEQKVSRQLWLYNTASAVERANAEANMWANPLPRSADLTVDLMTKGATVPVTPNLLTANQASGGDTSGNTADFFAVGGWTGTYITSDAAEGSGCILTAAPGAGSGGAVGGNALLAPAPGVMHTVLASVRVKVGTRRPRINVNWYTAAFAYISSDFGLPVATGTGWAVISVSGTAPVNAAMAQWFIDTPDSGATGDAFAVDCVSIHAGTGLVWAMPGASVMEADVGQRIAISGMPAEAPTQTNFYIEAISDNVTETQWLRTFTVSPRLDFLTLDDASSGAIDSTFVLAP